MRPSGIARDGRRQLFVGHAAAHHRRIRGAGRDGIDGDVVLRQRTGEAARHRDDAALRRGVGHRPAEAAAPPALRGEVDDAPAASLGPQGAGRGLVEEEGRLEVDVVLKVPVGLATPRRRWRGGRARRPRRRARRGRQAPATTVSTSFGMPGDRAQIGGQRQDAGRPPSRRRPPSLSLRRGRRPRPASRPRQRPARLRARCRRRRR